MGIHKKLATNKKRIAKKGLNARLGKIAQKKSEAKPLAKNPADFSAGNAGRLRKAKPFGARDLLSGALPREKSKAKGAQQ